MPAGPPEPQLPHPECGSRIHRDNYLILVITGVEAGDRAPLRCSAAEWTCWPAVGRQPVSCCRHVDDSTVVHKRRRPSTVRPRLTPRPSPADAQVGRAGRDDTAALSRVPGQRPRSERGLTCAPERPKLVAARPPRRAGSAARGPRRSSDLPNLCTFLGATSRPVDAAHPARTPDYRPT